MSEFYDHDVPVVSNAAPAGSMYRIGNYSAVQLKDGGVLEVKHAGNTYCERMRYDSVTDWKASLPEELKGAQADVGNCRHRLCERPIAKDSGDDFIYTQIMRMYRLHGCGFGQSLSLSMRREQLVRASRGRMDETIKAGTDPLARSIVLLGQQCIYVMGRNSKTMNAVSYNSSAKLFHYNGKVGSSFREVGVPYIGANPDFWIVKHKSVFKHVWV
jgi:hypothetical protein